MVKGALIGGSTSLILMLISPTFRHVRIPVKVFYNAAWISCGAVWCAEKQVLSFEARVAHEESIRRARILDEAADRGIYLEDDKRSLDDGLYR
ncbi:hypothetical protein BN7_3089 [Wickerhamomyces ciferrii]|uniref:Uncharacterized protein n=1 Tax=Wickerhamomyces ciferrii (strain ATCC 14091 / BCRC 22168 / CBS 111 / JCM 3599 / NBRC 0793 / NRRL Y-1031 F-60-10) TaxID=1206466 RepID=K0KMU3_WICCF|nr:uncharacterized protein BN7_3089 [Wickerhamomyces ciferrii]CCH43537.1 hypothetical protein BN7_3089 [Wickerhamomyces ciferrii]